jgi:hypothetical protein
MVFSAAFLAAAARAPAKLCQLPSRTGRRRLRADEVLRALFMPPARELARLADFLVDFFCLPLPEYYVPGSAGRGGVWVARAPSTALYRYRRSLSFSSSSSSEGEFYYLED